MATIHWQDEYSVGIKELDDQHKNLLDIFNQIAAEQEDKYDRDKFSTSLSTLIHYAYTHFATEENYLDRANFPLIEQHVLEHIDFIMKTMQLALGIENGGDENRKELLNYLKEWYSLHVLGIDRQYIPFLKSIQN